MRCRGLRLACAGAITGGRVLSPAPIGDKLKPNQAKFETTGRVYRFPPWGASELRDFGRLLDSLRLRGFKDKDCRAFVSRKIGREVSVPEWSAELLDVDSGE